VKLTRHRQKLETVGVITVGRGGDGKVWQRKASYRWSEGGG
jgi:hypothetical protein